MATDNDNIVLCYPNRADQATLTGGSWTTNLPITNMQNRVIKRRARTTDATTDSTKFSLTWDRSRAVGVVALAGHNLTTEAKVRVKLYYDTGLTEVLYDSGVVNVWPSVFDSLSLEWEDPNFWFGTLGEEERLQFTPLYTIFMNEPNKPEGVTSQGMTIEIFDTGNLDGYVEIGRLFFSSVYEPTRNANLGLSFQYSTSTEVESTLDDTDYFDRRNPKRNVQFVLDRLDTSEMFSNIFAMQRQIGIDGEVLFAYTTLDVLDSYERKFLGRLSQLDAISEPYVDRRHSVPISITEII